MQHVMCTKKYEIIKQKVKLKMCISCNMLIDYIKMVKFNPPKFMLIYNDFRHEFDLYKFRFTMQWGLFSCCSTLTSRKTLWIMVPINLLEFESYINCKVINSKFSHHIRVFCDKAKTPDLILGAFSKEKRGKCTNLMHNYWVYLVDIYMK